MTIKRLFASLVAAVAFCGSAHAVLITNPLDVDEYIQPLGEPDTTTYGYVFTTPDATNTVLDSFSFWLLNGNGISHLYGGVAPWVGNGADTALFESSSFSGPYGSVTEVTVNTGGLALIAGQQYVAYFSAAGLFDGSDDFVYMGLSSGNNGGGLGMAWDNSNGVSPNGNFSWNGGCNYCSFISLAGTMSFSSSVPEPGSLALLGFGLAGLGFSRRRKA